MRDFPVLSTFRSHLNTDHTCDLPEIRKIFQLHYGTVNRSPSQCLATAGIALCLQSNSVAVRLYIGNESNVSDDCAILADKNCNCDSSDVLKYLA